MNGGRSPEKRGWDPKADIHAHPLDNPKSHLSAHGVGGAFWWWLILSGVIVGGYISYQMFK